MGSQGPRQTKRSGLEDVFSHSLPLPPTLCTPNTRWETQDVIGIPLRVGIDSTAGEWNSPAKVATREFVYEVISHLDPQLSYYSVVHQMPRAATPRTPPWLLSRCE